MQLCCWGSEKKINFKHKVKKQRLTLAWLMRTDSSLEAKPPKMRLCGAPIRAQANMVNMACGTMGM